MKTVSLRLLDRVEIASPCPARWEDMAGDERVRHCAECSMKVHNLSSMSRDEAEALIQAAVGERLCVRLYRRADGTILTQDCPVGLARVRRAARRALVRVAALVGVTGVAGAMSAADTWGDRMRLRALKPFSIVSEWIAPGAAPAPMPMGPAMAGKMMIMPPPTPTAPGPVQPTSAN